MLQGPASTGLAKRIIGDIEAVSAATVARQHLVGRQAPGVFSKAYMSLRERARD